MNSEQSERLMIECAHCHRVRKNGRWTSRRSYSFDLMRFEFAHGVCPDCMAKLHPGFCFAS